MNLLGRQVRYTLNGETIEGVCIGSRVTGTTIRNTETGEEWPGIKFELRREDGTTRWTVAYPDREAAP